MDPFRIEGPAVISFSGGRTSGYMLHRILDAHGGKLPDDVFVSFQNTGKEMNETLDFVQACSDRWAVPIVWLEYQEADDPQARWRVVDHATASRKGEPFEALISRKNFLPNPTMRFCTIELKIRAAKLWAQQALGFKHWDMVIGMRADEPRRVAKLSLPHREPFDRIAPLSRAGVSVADVGIFWASQPFDLGLPNMNGKTMHGNCDLCFLKGGPQVLSLIREQPSRATWWIERERERELVGVRNPMMARFRSDRPSYAAMRDMALDHGEMFDYDDALDDCACTD